jgi:hypothetical protein
VTDIGCVAGFFDSIKRDASSIGRDGGEDAVSDLFLAGTIDVGDVNGVIALERDMPITAKTEAGDAANIKRSRVILFMAMRA